MDSDERIILKLAYDGTGFAGWQKQSSSSQPTVQGTLEKCLSQLFSEPVKTIGSGRTDAGVHALGQIVHFDCPKPLANYDLQKSLNSMLPASMVVRGVWRAPQDFHALASATGKHYRYRIWNSPTKNPFVRHFTLWERRPIDLHWLNQSSRYLIGTHDFKSFQTAGTAVSSTERTVHLARWLERRHHLIEFQISGSGFLKQMIRNIVGTLLDLQLSGASPEHILPILEAKDRARAKGTASPEGLCLMRVEYPPLLDSQLIRL